MTDATVKTGEARVRFGFPSGGRYDDTPHAPFCNLYITDTKSGTEFLEVSLSRVALADLLGSREVKGQFTLRPDHVGDRYEHKTEVVFVPRMGTKDKQDAAIEAALAPFEAEGWAGSRADASNRHRVVRQTNEGVECRINFYRFVRETEAPNA